MVGASGEFIAVAFDDCVSTVEFFFLPGMLLDVFLDLLARQSLWIQAAARRHGLCSRERPMFVDQIEAASVNHQQPPEFRIGRGFEKRKRFGVTLTPEDAIEPLRCLDQLFNHPEFARVEAGSIEGHLHGLPFG